MGIDLEILYSADAAETFQSTEASICIGRDPACEVVIQGLAFAAHVADKHAQIDLRADRAFLQDLGSSSGTFLNGRPVTSSAVFHVGDCVRVGKSGPYLILTSLGVTSAPVCNASPHPAPSVGFLKDLSSIDPHDAGVNPMPKAATSMGSTNYVGWSRFCRIVSSPYVIMGLVVLVAVLIAFGLSTEKPSNSSASKLREEFAKAADEILIANKQKQLGLSKKLSREIKEFFDQKKILASNFFNYVTLNRSFREKYRKSDATGRHECLMEAFCQIIVSEEDIANQISSVAKKMARNLQEDWTDLCVHLGSNYDLILEPLQADFASSRFTSDLMAGLKYEVKTTLRLDVQGVLANRKDLDNTIDGVQKSALELCPLFESKKLGATVGIPIFVAKASGDVFDYVANLISGDDKKDVAPYKEEVQRRLDRLGEKIAVECEGQMVNWLSLFHKCQAKAVKTAIAKLTQ